MSFKIVVYLANKKMNSMYDPTAYSRPAVKYEMDALLKDSTDIVRPTFQLHLATGDLRKILYQSATYIQCTELQRKYFITNRRAVTSTIIEFDCVTDVLVSFSQEILTTPCYIQFIGKKYNSLIPDDRISLMSTVKQRAVSTPIQDFLSVPTLGGTWVVQFAAQGGSSPARIFALDGSQMMDLLNRIYDKDFYQKVKDAFISIDGLFLSCMFYPLQPSKFGNVYDKIEVLDEVLVYNARICSDVISGYEYISIPMAYQSTHDDGNGTSVTDYSHFLNYPPYSKHTIFLPYAGLHELSVQGLIEDERNAIPQNPQFLLDYNIVPATGSITYYLHNKNTAFSGEPLTQAIKGVIGIQMPVPHAASNSMQGIMDIIGSVASAGVAVATHNPVLVASSVGNTIKGIASAIPNLASVSNGASGTVGGWANYALFGRSVYVTVTYPDVAGNMINFEYAGVMGAPLNVIDTLDKYCVVGSEEEVYAKVYNFFPPMGRMTQEEYEMLLDIINTTKQYVQDGFYLSR